MITIDHQERVVHVAVLGEFMLADIKELEAFVENRVSAGGPVDLLFDLREMASFTVDMAWEEIKFSRQHSADFRRIAVLSDSQWVTWSAWLNKAFVSADVEVFDDETEARDWLAE